MDFTRTPLRGGIRQAADENVQARSASKSVIATLALASCLYLGNFASVDRLKPTNVPVIVLETRTIRQTGHRLPEHWRRSRLEIMHEGLLGTS